MHRLEVKDWTTARDKEKERKRETEREEKLMIWNTMKKNSIELKNIMNGKFLKLKT
jgi:hypothetical protein